jgi:hypothetical protein
MPFAPLLVRPEIAMASAGDIASGTAAAAAVTYPATAGVAHAVTEGVAWSYSGTGTLSGGRLTVAIDGTTVFDMDITAKGQDFVAWRRCGTVGGTLVVTLAGGGADVTGKVSVLGHTRLYGVPDYDAGELDFSDAEDSGLLAVL